MIASVFAVLRTCMWLPAPVLSPVPRAFLVSHMCMWPSTIVCCFARASCISVADLCS